MNNIQQSRHRIALAVACLLLGLAAPTGQAAVTVTGSWSIDPFEPGPLDGPHLSRPASRLYLGTGGDASFAALAGSVVDLYTLTLATGAGSTVSGLLDGGGTALVLRGNGDTNRLEVGNAGAAALTVSGGALLDGRAVGWVCLQGQGWCNNYVGNAAGSNGQLTVTGAGSEVRLQNGFTVASLGLGPGWGQVGGTTTGRVEVLAGGRLSSDSLFAGVSGTNEALANGQERSLAFLTIAGANSLWEVAGMPLGTGDARLVMAHGARATTEVQIADGGVLRAKATSGNAVLRLADSGGQATTVVDQGRIELLSPLQSFAGVALNAGSQGELQMDQGVLLLQAQRTDLQVGAGGGQGRLQARGGQITLNATADSAIGVGIEGGQGELALSQGAALALTGASSRYVVVGRGTGGSGVLSLASGASFAAGVLNVGSERGTGTVTLDGNGTVLALDNPPDSHRLAVGDWGTGALTVSGGALLDTTGGAAACVNRWCGSIIGHMAGSTALLTVTGAGSDARLIGEMRVGATQRYEPSSNAGTPGGITHARVEVLDGGRLVNEWAGTGGWQPGPTSQNEQSFADIVVAGAGSTWLVQGSALAGGNADIAFSSHARSTTTLDVSGGGLVRLQAPDGLGAGLYLSADQGRSTVTLRDDGSQLQVQGTDASIVVGGWSSTPGAQATLVVREGARLVQDGSQASPLSIGEAGSQGVMEIRSGGQASGARNVTVGNGGDGRLLITDAGSLLSTDRRGPQAGQVYVGQQGKGRLDVLAGGAASVFSLQVGNGFDHLNSRGQVLIDGVGSRVTADGIDWHRLGLENGSLTVSGGGVLDAAGNTAGCVGHWCGAFLANNAGGDVSLTVTGVGSRASFLSNLIAGGSWVTAPPATGYSLGEPGAASQVLIEVLAGGLLETEAVSLGYGPQGPAALGSEAATVKVRLDGAGSRWTLAPASGATTFATGLAGGANTDVNIAVSGGARLALVAQAGQTANLQLARDGGTTALSVIGNGSELAMSGGTTRTLLIGRNQGQASVVLMDGARLSGASNVVVGLNQGSSAASGFLMLDGENTRGQISGSSALLRVGQGAWGHVQLNQGAQLSLDGSLNALVTVGSYNFNAAGSALLGLSDAGTRLDVRTGGASGAANPSMTVGSTLGMLNVVNGARLRLEGGFESTPAAPRLTTLTVGSSTTLSSGLLAGQGFMDVSGSGSRVEVAGADPRVLIGMNGGQGFANVVDGAVLASSYVGVGGNGGSGQLNLSAARIELAGQWTSQLLGPRLAVGFGSGSKGLVTLAAGAEVVLDGRAGRDRAALVLGGVTNTPLGSGRLLAGGGSSLTLLGAGSALFGQTGSGIGEFSGASRLDLDGGTLLIGRYAGATGELHLREASQAHAGAVLVGASALGVDGGQGWLQVTGGSALHAARMDIGSAGLLSGSGLIAVGLLTNRGSINPGDSPGTLELTGDFVNEAGGRLVLEVAADGHGGFVTDRLAFASGASVDLGAALIEFRFLGATDPNAFQASGGFRIDSFLSQAGAPLDHALLGGVSYAASSSAYQFTSFSFSAEGGAVFTAQPVPEPGTWVLFALGLGVTGWLQRRRTRQS